MAPIQLYEKMLKISNDFSSEASGPVLLKFHGSLLGAGERKIARNGCGSLTKIAAMPIYGKNL